MKNVTFISKNKQQGISLIEVLITVLVLAIGMLGFAALQVKTLSTTQESYSRSQAVAIIEDATARIRANSAFIANDPTTKGVDSDGNPIEDPDSNVFTNNKASGEFYQWCKVGSTPYVPTNLCTGSCDARELALSDIDSVCSSLDQSGVSNASIGVACFDRDAGVDDDNCSSGSKLALYLAWSQELRVDSGDKLVANTRCQKEPFSLADGFSCVIVELVP